MGSYTVIADAGKSLINLLRKELIPELLKKEEDIALCTPDDSGNAILGLYLYDVEEVPESRNRDRIQLDREHYKNPPTSLYLYYMLFVKTEIEVASRAVDEQRILGKAIQVFNDYAKLYSDELDGTLKENDEELDVQGIVIPFEEKQKIYTLFDKKGLYANFYKVGPVFIESNRIRRVKRVTSAKFDVTKK